MVKKKGDGGSGSKGAKVAPDDVNPDEKSPEDMTAEEKKRLKEKKIAMEYMNESMKRTMCNPVKARSGLIPWVISKNFPSILSSLMPRIFSGVPVPDVKGVAAGSVNMLGLSSSQVRSIYKCFRKIDFDESGKITMGQFMDFCEGEDTRFIRDVIDRVLFSMGGMHSRGELSFPEFVCATVLYCTYSKDQLLHKIFECFDLDNSGYLSIDEMENLVAAVGEANGGFGTGNAKNLIETLDANGDGMLDFDEFYQTSVDNPMVFFPAYKVQYILQKSTFGIEGWSRVRDKWVAKEKWRAEVLERDPIPISDHMNDISTYFATLKKGHDAKKAKGAKVAQLKKGKAGPKKK